MIAAATGPGACSAKASQNPIPHRGAPTTISRPSRPPPLERSVQRATIRSNAASQSADQGVRLFQTDAVEALLAYRPVWERARR